MSPEEFTQGAVIDEVTNVYAMGATAFALFGKDELRGHKDGRQPEYWSLSTAGFEVAKRAVSDDRRKRQQSIKQLIAEWDAAKY
jgi:serine/threonine-protein kinase